MARENDGRAIDYTPPITAVAAGEAVPIGNMIGVAPVAIAVGQKGALEVGGVHRLAKASGSGVTFGFGAIVQLDVSNQLAVASGGDVNAGTCVAGAADADDYVDVLINEVHVAAS